MFQHQNFGFLNTIIQVSFVNIYQSPLLFFILHIHNVQDRSFIWHHIHSMTRGSTPPVVALWLMGADFMV